MPKHPIVLASSSSYRQTLLAKLQLEFIAKAPEIDEAPLVDESPAQMAERLAIAKAHALQKEFPEHLIIGSDQVAALGKQIFNKPGNQANAIAQLQSASGQCLNFFTSLCILNSVNGEYFKDTECTRVYFKTLSLAQITRYVEIDQPFDCAGSFKLESLGIALFDHIDGSDYNALIGLPLIKLINLLQKFQVNVL